MFRRLIPLILLCLLATPGLAEEAPAPSNDASSAEISLPEEMPVVTDVSADSLDEQPDIVRDVQKRLANLGFYVGTIDGKYGQYSEEAVRAFQGQFGLAETGRLDAQTLSLITEYSEKNLSKRAIQQRLISLGYMQGEATGYIGPQTENALRLFQRINGMDETGLTDADTLALLFSDRVVSLPPAVSAKSAREDIVTLQSLLARLGFFPRAATGEYGKVTAAAVQAFQQHLIDQGMPVEATGAASPMTLYYLYDEDYSSYVYDVSVGMSGREVERIESRLSALGYLDDDPDDAFDDYTLGALRLFQQQSGLEPSGVADRDTVDTLFSDEAVPLPVGVNSDSDAEDIVRLQTALVQFGFMDGEADGAYGQSTVAAVQAFQAHLNAQGMPVRASGFASPLTLYYLYGDDYSTYMHDVSVGMTEAEAERIESRLFALGYMDMEADDSFDAYAREALRLFQQESGLEATGIADRDTVDALFSAQPVRLPAGLSADSEGADVTKLQRALIRFGFMAGDADGAYGESTAEAVQSFQRHLIEQGFPVVATGSASPLTLHYLYSDDYSSYLRDISVGATGDEVSRVELRLAGLGYMDAEADDAFDDYAEDALRLFQSRSGLEVTGIADRGTIDSLFAADVVPADRCAPHEISSGDSGSAVRDVENALLIAGYTNQLPDGKFDAALEKGLTNAIAFLNEGDSPTHLTRETVSDFQNGLLSRFLSPDTARVQRRLNTLYYLDKSGVDGVWGENTVAALHEFQAANGLPQTDVADQPTLSALFSDSAIEKRYPYRVEVSLSRQVVDVWKLNGRDEYDLVQSFTCSTGLHDTTPRGIFLNGFPQERWHYFKKFYCWAQYTFVIEGDILFHSVIFGSKNENSLHQSSLRNLGNPASHGCVRLSVEDAKWLYENCEKGSLVIVIS